MNACSRRIVVTAALGLAAATALAAELPRETLTITTAGGQRHDFLVEAAEQPETRARGLMFRRDMADNHGMIFAFAPPQEVSMWMKNTYLPLDMLFIRADGRIHHIAESTTPFSEATISSNGKVSFVLELNGGTARRLGLAPGDAVAHRLIGR